MSDIARLLRALTDKIRDDALSHLKSQMQKLQEENYALRTMANAVWLAVAHVPAVGKEIEQNIDAISAIMKHFNLKHLTISLGSSKYITQYEFVKSYIKAF